MKIDNFNVKTAYGKDHLSNCQLRVSPCILRSQHRSLLGSSSWHSAPVFLLSRHLTLQELTSILFTRPEPIISFDKKTDSFYIFVWFGLAWGLGGNQTQIYFKLWAWFVLTRDLTLTLIWPLTILKWELKLYKTSPTTRSWELLSFQSG